MREGLKIGVSPERIAEWPTSTEKMLNITNNRKINSNHCEISPYIH